MLPVRSVAELLRLNVSEFRQLAGSKLPSAVGDMGPALAPIDGRTEVWASGVTYSRSRAARVSESSTPDIYDSVYSAQRPELFFKSVAWRVVSPGQQIGVRNDSSWNVPEPELALVVNSRAEIIGYGICNDMSSRSIEGENPLYLPQAKVYARSCAISRGFRPVWELDATDLEVRLRIERDGAVAFEGSTRTSEIVRPFSDLVSYLFRSQDFPDGAWISTGTGIVPPDGVSLVEGDFVEVAIDGLPTVRNRVTSVLGAGQGR